MPAASAAFSFPPTAYTCRPSRIRERNIHAQIATTTSNNTTSSSSTTPCSTMCDDR